MKRRKSIHTMYKVGRMIITDKTFNKQNNSINKFNIQFILYFVYNINSSIFGKTISVDLIDVDSAF